ncbi:unnamed protein product [Allacma fusca]|uniref:Uncharacterized protein n=1 Tax=Allacma fusca TaxID=39272 RepID=A0A8J2PEU3_9HEXA|nr:unnamed protein product [Allacma fusca]
MPLLSTGFLTDTNANSRDKDKDKEPGGRGDREKSASLQRVRITDANQVYDGLNLGRRIDVVWPDESMRARGGRSYWQNWVPEDGMEGMCLGCRNCMV